jgi:hypothetical protein
MMHVAEDDGLAGGVMVDVELVCAAAHLARALCLDGFAAPSHVGCSVAVAVVPAVLSLSSPAVDGARLELRASWFAAHMDSGHESEE